jgi:C_GCAxxG_C_C family probable redox protein
MRRSELAAEYSAKGFNCAQSVLCAFCQDYGLDETTALRVATGFGSGMGRLCQVCGALTGGFMVIGLKHSRTQAGEQYKPVAETAYHLVHELATRFEARNGSAICGELLGVDLNDPEQHQQAREAGLFKTRCPKYIQDSVEILEDLLQD